MSLSALQYNPMHLRVGRYQTVEEVVTLTDLQAGGMDVEKRKNLADLLTASEIKIFEQVYDSSTDKTIVVKAKACELVTRKLARDESFSMEHAEEWVQLGLNRDYYRTFTQLAEEYLDPNDLPSLQETTPSPISEVLETASHFHFALYRFIYTTAMKLNQWDFERLFAERSCVHDGDLVYELAKDASFRPTDDQRKQHFLDNREMSFGIMMSFAGFMVYEQTTNPDMRVISMATAYNVLKGVFNPEPGATPAPTKADIKGNNQTK
ncbi:MAG: hypothetical protein JZU49_06345 [Sulfuricurvum sp.]|nr:hypothetical protein [Sulfuricurvum sp.]